VSQRRHHAPEISSCIVSDKSSVEYKEFFQYFSSKFQLGYKEFQEELTEEVTSEDE
jgi:hypothetical protein